MKIYSDYPVQRARQVIADACALAAIWFTIAAARALGDRINAFKALGVRMEDAGAGFRTTMTDIGQSLADVPLVGDGISAPFSAAANAGGQLQSAGAEQQAAVGELAVNVAVTVAVLPLAAILLVWLVPRLRFAWRAARTKRLLRHEGALDLLALRALLTGDPLRVLTAVDHPAQAWREHDKGAIRTLAALELRSSGVAIKPSGRARRRAARPLA